LRSLGILAIAAVIGQAVLGGMTVLFRLPPALSVGHAALAQAFFCITFAIALATSSRWELKSSRVNCVRAQSAKLFGIAVMGLIVVQLLLGAVMRHTGSGLAIPDFPLSYGHIIPPFFTSQIIYNFTHRAMALVVICFAAWFSVKALRLNPTPLFVRFPSILLLALLIIQLSLGAETVWSHKAPLPTTLHVACGALILGTCLWLTMNIYKAAKPGSPADLHLTSSIGQKVR
jgi:cytochrome c oxidase assembly protein subunit 15